MAELSLARELQRSSIGKLLLEGSAVKELLLAVGADVDWQTVDAHALVNESAPIWQSKCEASIWQSWSGCHFGRHVHKEIGKR